MLRKLLFRATKGKVLCKVYEDAAVDYSVGQTIDQNAEGDDQESQNTKKPPPMRHDSKCVYVLVFQDQSILKQKVMKICDSFSPNNRRFSLPKNGQGSQ